MYKKFEPKSFKFKRLHRGKLKLLQYKNAATSLRHGT